MAKKGKGKTKGKANGKTTKPAPKKEKKEKKVEVVVIKHSKAKPDADINPVTGSRFKPNTSAQIALDIVCAGATAGKNSKEIREELGAYRKENGKARNLDKGYFPFVVATHPDHFQLKSDGAIKQLKKFKPDPAAVKKLEEAKAKRQAKKDKRKNSPNGKAKGKKGKGKSKKPTLKK